MEAISAFRAAPERPRAMTSASADSASLALPWTSMAWATPSHILAKMDCRAVAVRVGVCATCPTLSCSDAASDVMLDDDWPRPLVAEGPSLLLRMACAGEGPAEGGEEAGGREPLGGPLEAVVAFALVRAAANMVRFRDPLNLNVSGLYVPMADMVDRVDSERGR
jgi:hypothetical protein